MQNLRLYVLVGILSLIILVLVMMLVSGTQTLTTSKKALSYKAQITSGAARLDPKEVWAEKFAIDHELQAKRLETLEKLLQTLMQINQPEDKTVSGLAKTPLAKDDTYLQQGLSKSANQSFSNSPTLSDPLGETIELRHNLQVATANNSSRHNASNNSGNSSGDDFIKNVFENNAAENNATSPKTNLPPRTSAQSVGVAKSQNSFRSKGIQRTTIALLNNKSQQHLKTADNTIPAGAFAGAVMVGGVDASTSIQASSDPRPVLLRITDPGTLPRKFKSDLCGCHVLAACYGDISSERVYMRLEKLTCTERKTGEIVEMTVNGYVAGEDGRAGLRGVVVDRAGESMRNAAIGGFLSGMGNFLSQAHNPVTFSPINGLAQTNPMTSPEMLKFGAAKGASGALDKYAEFYIKRAEQMQPVIQVQAGRRVDIVITAGVAFENSAARGEMIKVNDQQRLSQLHNPGEASLKPVETWIPKNQAQG